MVKVNYNVSIKESFSEDGEFIIQGTAINATTTDNGHTFLVEELRPAAESLTGVPLLVDHDALVENIKGRVIVGEFNEAEEKIDFRARVVDEKIKRLIKDGLLNTVSVGANVKEIQEGENGNLIARGIKFKELSLVAAPADDGATFGIAMSEAYKLQSNDIKEATLKSKENLQDMKGGSENNMENNNEILEAIESMGKTLKEDFEKKLDEKVEAMEKSFSEKLAIKESDADEAKAKEEADKVEADKVAKESDEAAEAEAKAKADAEEDAEEEEEEKAEESAKYDIVEGSGSLRGNSFSYNW